MILNCEGWTATDAKCAHMASAEARFYNLYENIRARGASEYSAEWIQGEAHPWQGGYIATFFENGIRIASNVIIINIVVIQAVIWLRAFVFLLHPCLPNLWQSGRLKLNLIWVGGW